jgi:trimethylamine:corrinoid methyltransferase-like protein
MSRRRARKRNLSTEQLVPPKAQQLFNPYDPVAALDAESLDMIHDASMRILEDIGLEILNEDWIATRSWQESRPYPPNLPCMRPIPNVID